MNKMILTPNDYKHLAEMVIKKIDFLQPNKTQTFENLDLYKNNLVLFFDIETIVFDGCKIDYSINNIICFDTETNNTIPSNFDESKLNKYLH